MHDPTEEMRREMVETINAQATNNEDADRARLEERWGKDNVWRYDEVQEHFEIIGFLAPFCSARRKSDGQKGVLEFQHHPRFYYNFMPDSA